MAEAISKEEVINELKRVDGLVDGPLTVSELHDIGNISRKPAERHFGTWNKAKRAAGIDTIEKDGLSKENINKKSRSQKRRCIKAVQEYSPCHRCGENYPSPVHDYHHVTGDKVKEVVQMTGAKWRRITNEMRKTVILCANCHRLIEHTDATIDKDNA